MHSFKSDGLYVFTAFCLDAFQSDCLPFFLLFFGRFSIRLFACIYTLFIIHIKKQAKQVTVAVVEAYLTKDYNNSVFFTAFIKDETHIKTSTS
ncbi:hypothetical protein IX83_04785 [Basilea psittacipulmonis DSM 24701]|uniref:Uncharacterized protein n=1 Tax=Basilea psittacipulmonis DSM 24701 TaxID=1072685 RepID=A0A077DDL9_9BURK|nr:hypothetical protein IX83_04785 [Basilea psittacipulmonis DSM 24701]